MKHKNIFQYIGLTLTAVFFLFPQVVHADIVDDTQADFGSGTHTNTQWDSGNNWLEMDATGLSSGFATFTSRVFNGSSSVSWDTFSWVPQRPLLKELPNSGGVESAYTEGNIDMSNNTLLYHLNESSGNATDNSGNSYTGTVNGTMSYSASGRFNTSYSFGGGYISTGVSGSSLVSAGTKTVSVWIYPTGSAPSVSESYAGEGIVADMSSRYWGLYRANIGGADKIWAYNWDSNEDKVGVTYATNEWIHIVYVHSGGTLSIYKNGLLADSVTSGNTDSLTSIVGIAPSSYQGKIDEVAVWSRALSATEIMALYKRGALRIKYQVRSCDDGSCSGESFVGQSGSTSNWFEEQDSNGTGLPSFSLSGVVGNNQYFQYQVVLETSTSTYSPEIKSVTAGTSATEGGGGGGGGAGVPEFTDFLYISTLAVALLFTFKKIIPTLRVTVRKKFFKKQVILS